MSLLLEGDPVRAKRTRDDAAKTLLPMARLNILTHFRSEAPFRGGRQGSREVSNYMKPAGHLHQWPATTVQRGAPLDGTSEYSNPFPERIPGRRSSENVQGTQLKQKRQHRKGLILRERRAPRLGPTRTREKGQGLKIRF